MRYTRSSVNITNTSAYRGLPYAGPMQACLGLVGYPSAVCITPRSRIPKTADRSTLTLFPI